MPPGGVAYLLQLDSIHGVALAPAVTAHSVAARCSTELVQLVANRPIGSLVMLCDQ